jgi:hypothetical protein
LDQSEYSFGLDTLEVTRTSPNYQLLSWPPAREWPVVFNKGGEVVSRWGDPTWNLSAWLGKPAILDFGDGSSGKAERVDPANADLLRLIATWLIWGPRAVGSVNTVKTSFSYARQVVCLCSRNGIYAGQLTRFKKVLDQVPETLSASKYEQSIALFHRLYDARNLLGFTILDASGLKKLAAAAREREPVQTPYIPPRIWTYQVGRLRECILEFLANRDRLEECFWFCLEAYVESYGSIEEALSPSKDPAKLPFSPRDGSRKTFGYQGPFSETAVRFGIEDLLRRWISGGDEIRHSHLSAYMSLVAFAALAYIGNFSLQRKEEVASLRTSCLIWEEDEKMGRVPIICGETTKTDRDSDARWIASPSVDEAVQAASVIARLRMVFDRKNATLQPSEDHQKDPYLASAATEPWGMAVAQTRHPYNIRQPLLDLRKAVKDRYPFLFDTEQLRISEEDLAIAHRLTPNLDTSEFAVGNIWPLAWHQYRRTGCVNMFSSRLVSDSSVQQLMKHSTRLMSLFYARNHGRLHLNAEVRDAVIRAMYEAQAETILHVIGSHALFSPHSDDRTHALTVNVLSARDYKDYVAMAKRGTIMFREHRLGGCMKAGACEFGGIESVARCAGGDGSKPCAEVVYDKSKAPQVRADVVRVSSELERLSPEHPRHKALSQELRAMENYLDEIGRR